MGGVLWMVCLIALCSAFWDVHTYAERQYRWERDHPNVDYVPGYHKKARKAAKVYEKYQREKGNDDNG